ncbi:alpha-L-fucosidase [Enterococcus faecalis]|uniref:alpha-L-fucosidase n=1 Tax=Enterococcus faecalis TaxID=1351 RepID=UPI0001F0D2E9|nr:alpha-L-fucosidase [Enterococcus faecalis]EFT95523.1 Alpha-L-fucosidase [Enterococcus faecalis TX0012]
MSKIRLDIEENKATDQEAYPTLSLPLQKKIEWFKDQKIGIIFHWGLYSLAGIVESWQLSKEDNWARKKPWRKDLEALRKDYWQLNHSFNPVKFDPNDWAKKVKNAGFKYMLFTTKHHDGFNMYDTHFTTYKITNSDCPYAQNSNADIFGSLVKAFNEEGISTGAYYSKADWHSPLYWVPGEAPIGRYASYNPLENPMMWTKYNQFVENQLLELNKNYGDLDILWLDGGWVNAKNHEFLNMHDIVSKLRKINPELLVVDRTIGGEFENYVTPERKIPEKIPMKAWESNIPLAKNWGYVPDDQYKSFEEVLKTIIQIVSLGGNVILGVGPKPDGTLPLEAQEIMIKLGKWLDIYGEGIYQTRPYRVNSINNQWYLTKKDNKIFAFLLPLVNVQSKYILDLNDLNSKASIISCIDIKTGKEIDLKDNKLTIESKEIRGVKLILGSEEKNNE